MIGNSELIFLVVVFLILFGGKRLPLFARSLGEAVSEFRSASKKVLGDLEVEGGKEREFSG
ncbi:MAG: twin-arginine translocase TatA/TatE family subunit [Methanobacteriota archaeon]